MKSGHEVQSVYFGYQVFALALRLLRNRLMIAALAVFGIIAASLGIGLMVTARAPSGYEDETGFHFGQEEGAAQEKVPYAVPEPKLV
jgi:hypothetical protein